MVRHAESIAHRVRCSQLDMPVWSTSKGGHLGLTAHTLRIHSHHAKPPHSFDNPRRMSRYLAEGTTLGFTGKYGVVDARSVRAVGFNVCRLVGSKLGKWNAVFDERAVCLRIAWFNLIIIYAILNHFVECYGLMKWLLEAIWTNIAVIYFYYYQFCLRSE